MLDVLADNSKINGSFVLYRRSASAHSFVKPPVAVPTARSYCVPKQAARVTRHVRTVVGQSCRDCRAPSLRGCRVQRIRRLEVQDRHTGVRRVGTVISWWSAVFLSCRDSLFYRLLQAQSHVSHFRDSLVTTKPCREEPDCRLHSLATGLATAHLERWVLVAGAVLPGRRRLGGLGRPPDQQERQKETQQDGDGGDDGGGHHPAVVVVRRLKLAAEP